MPPLESKFNNFESPKADNADLADEVPDENEVDYQPEFSEVIIEERETLVTQTSVMAPSEYLDPPAYINHEYTPIISPEK